MKQKLIGGLLAALLAVSVMPFALAAEERPARATIEPRPTDAVIAVKPETAVKRSEAVSRLWELMGKPEVDALLTFRDVEEGSEAAESIRWAAAAGITNGYTAEHFGPEDAVTREQLAAMIYRLAQSRGQGFRGAWMFYLGCADLDQVQEWAVEPMYWMVASRFYEGGADALLRPKDSVTVQEADAIFAGLGEKLGF